MIQFILNEKTIATDLPAGMVLLDFIRYQQNLKGTKIGCREGDCGACLVLVGDVAETQNFASRQDVASLLASVQYKSMTSCLVPLGNVQGKHIVTIEGINQAATLNPIQQAMAEEGATQCGFCTPGFVVALAGFCLTDIAPTQGNVIAAIDGNICRCTGYKSIERAATRVTELLKKRNGEEPTVFAARKKILPEYFVTIKDRLLQLQSQQVKTPAANPATIVGGGTDLYVQKQEEMTNASIRFALDDQQLKGISREGNKCIIGASVTVSDLAASPILNEAFPNFPRYVKLVSSTPIRNMATIAGNFINASPIGDFTIFFLALDARVDLTRNASPGESGVRTIALRDLYTGYKELNKDPDEMISRTWFELPRKQTLFHFEKVSKRTHLDIASVNSAISITIHGDIIERAGVAAGGVGPVPLFLKKTSVFLKGKKVAEALVQEAIEIMKTEISPISDARGTKEYKTLLLGQLIRAHFQELFPGMGTEKLYK